MPNRTARRYRDDTGSSLIEFVVAISVFALFSTFTMMNFGSILNATRTNKDRISALNLANAEIESLRMKGATTLVNSGLGSSTSTKTVNNMTFTIVTDKQWESTTSSSSATCDLGTMDKPKYIRVSSTVSWQQQGASHQVRSTTIVAPPTFVLDPNNGSVSLAVTEADGSPAQGVTIALYSGTDTTTQPFKQQTTTAQGCAIFILAPGTYTLKPLDSTRVDTSLNGAPTTQVTIASSQATQQFLVYDLKSTLNDSFTVASDAALPAGGLTSTIYNTGLTPNFKTYAASGAPSYAGLFPFTSGYYTWAGACLDADPQGVNPNTSQQYWTGAVRDTVAAVTPGQTTTDTIATATTRLAITRGTPTAVGVAGVTVKLTHAADARCASGETYTLGATKADGTLNSAVPFGTWTITATPTVASGLSNTCASGATYTSSTGACSRTITVSPLSPNVSLLL